MCMATATANLKMEGRRFSFLRLFFAFLLLFFSFSLGFLLKRRKARKVVVVVVVVVTTSASSCELFVLIELGDLASTDRIIE